MIFSKRGVLDTVQRQFLSHITLTQLFVGSLIGIIFSCCVFYTTKYYLDSQTDKNVTLIYNVSKWLFKKKKIGNLNFPTKHSNTYSYRLFNIESNIIFIFGMICVDNSCVLLQVHLLGTVRVSAHIDAASRDPQEWKVH